MELLPGNTFITMFFGFFVVMLLIGVVGLVLRFYLLREGVTAVSRFSQQSTPLDILKMRYAKGEISKQQFDAMRKDLQV